jgi:hypothetical protein
VSFHSIINIPPSPNKPILIFHASFADYLTDRNQCPPQFYLDATACNTSLALKSLKCMNRLLTFNICRIDRGHESSTISFENRRMSIREGLEYSCVYWASHLKASSVTCGVIFALYTFINEHLLHWIECLSIINQLSTAVQSLRIAVTFLSQVRCHLLFSHSALFLSSDLHIRMPYH